MDNNATFAISAAGMNLERARVEAAAMNLANANTVAAPAERAFQPMQVIARTAAAASFGEALAQQALAAGLVPEAALVPSPLPPRRVHEPGHPLADAQGFVSYPGVDTAAEMMTLLSATRAYEANVSAMNVARTLAMKSLDIGGNS